MVELVDALDLDSTELFIWVQVPLSAYDSSLYIKFKLEYKKYGLYALVLSI